MTSSVNLWKFQVDTISSSQDTIWSLFSLQILVFKFWLSLNMSTLHTLTSKVTSQCHLDFKMLVTKFCLLARKFMSVGKCFRYKNSCSRWEQSLHPQATEVLWNVSLKNVWSNHWPISLPPFITNHMKNAASYLKGVLKRSCP